MLFHVVVKLMVLYTEHKNQAELSVVSSPAQVAQWYACGTHDQVDPRLRRTFFPMYFRLSPLQRHVRKVVGGFGKKKLC